MKLSYFEFKRHTFLRISILVIGLGLISGCTTGPKEKKLEVGGFALMYKPLKSLDSELKNIAIKHPAKISLEAMKTQLSLLKYRDLSLFGKNKAIFSLKSINLIARLLSKALEHSSPGKIIFFELESSGGKTKGQLFHTKNKLHWRFSQISGRNFDLSNRGVSLFKGKGRVWKLIPQQGQILKKTKGVFSSTWDNWLVSELKRPIIKEPRKHQETRLKESKNSQLPNRKPSSPIGKSVVEDKLNILNNLKLKGLIDNKEYEKRRGEILDRFL